MRTARFFAPTLIALASLAAGDAPPLVDLEMPSLARTVERLEASPWGALYNDPAMAPMREQVAMFWAEAAKGAGMDAKAALLATTNVRFQLHKLEFPPAKTTAPPKPVVIGQASFGAMSQAVWDAVKAKNKDKPAATVAGADAAMQIESDPPITMARFKDTLVSGSGVPLKPMAASAEISDVVVRVDWKAYMKFVEEYASRQQASPNAAYEAGRLSTLALGRHLSAMRMTARITNQGFSERIEMATAIPGNKPVDRDVLARLPVDTMLLLSNGIDGKAQWNAFGTAVLAMIASIMSQQSHDDSVVTAEQVLAMGDGALKGMGIEGGVANLISTWQGTMVIAISSKPGLPAISVLLPRTPSIDKLVAFALAQAGVEAAADPKDITAIPMKPNPLTPALHLAADATHWILSTDKAPVTLWLSGKPSGFLNTAVAKNALTRAPATAHTIGLSDTPVVLKTISTALGLFMGAGSDNPQLTMIKKGLAVLAAKAGTGSLWMNNSSSGGLEMETQGLVGFGTMNPIIAAIAIPNLLESRVVANESVAAVTLKSGIHPAQIQFSAGAYRDTNIDGRGEYGFLSEMAGGPIAGVEGSRPLSLLGNEKFKAADPVNNGYRYRVFLPSAQNAGTSSATVAVAAAKADMEVCYLQEAHWVAYAWPESEKTGRRMFAITANGIVYAKPFTGQEPTWNSLTGAKEWTTEVPATSDWKPYSR